MTIRASIPAAILALALVAVLAVTGVAATASGALPDHHAPACCDVDHGSEAEAPASCDALVCTCTTCTSAILGDAMPTLRNTRFGVAAQIPALWQECLPGVPTRIERPPIA